METSYKKLLKNDYPFRQTHCIMEKEDEILKEYEEADRQ